MKKFLTIMLVLIVAIGASAQDKSRTLPSRDYVKSDISFSVATDTIGVSDSYSIELLANKAEPLKYDIEVSIDAISGSPNVAAVLSGRIFEDDAETTIETITWAGTSADTTIRFTEHTTALYWRYYTITLTSTATAQKSWISDNNAKFWSK